MTRFLVSQTQRFWRQMEQIRLLPKAHRSRIAEQIFREIRPYLERADADDLRELRRHAQERRAILLYAGARDFTDVRFAEATIIEQWALARMELNVSRSLTEDVLAERCLNAIEDFVRNNLPSVPE